MNIRIENSTDQIRHYHRRSSSALGFTYQYKTNRSHADGPNPEELTLWFNGEDIDLAEVACARLQNFSKCTTRIVENRKHATELQAENEARPNILLVLLDPMSRPHFERSMPKTKATLHRLGFTHFGNYSAVGSNSGPNQAALYSGTPVSNRDGIQRDVGDEKWLWDLLRKNGYVTLKAEDGCIENSNMLQSLAPNTTHGQALHRMFCFDFDRPNCLGPELASTHLLRYADHFVSTYEHRRRKIEPGLRWAAFLHFIDSHEDTMVLSSSVDPGLSKFLQRLDEEQKLDETLVIFLSDHGLHYGPYFQSRSGRREATEPLLYMRVPPYLQSIVNMKAFFSNARLWTTPYDVHETLVTLTGIQQQPTTVDHTRKGLSLFQQLPDNRRSCKGTAEIPALYCDLHLNGRNGDALSPGSCKKMPRPPSVLSFFADIPLHQRPQFDFDCKRMHNASVSNPSNHRQCQCATSHREWVRCSEHPWGREEIKSKNHPEEYFALMKCKGQKLAVDTRVVQQSSLLSRREEQKNPVGKDTRRKQPPNILFLEVDSVSLAYADRHLPLTRSLLKRHQMRQDPEGKTECNNGVCAADFSLFSLVGPNSVANQVSNIG